MAEQDEKKGQGVIPLRRRLKWILLFTHPNGTQWAATSVHGKFALTQCIDGKVESAIAFSSLDDLRAYWKSMVLKMRPEDVKRFLSYKPVYKMVRT